jgi:hypothetical protein
VERQLKTTKNLSQGRQSSGRDFDPGPPEYEAEVPATQPRRPVGYHVCLQVGPAYRERNRDLKNSVLGC